MEFWLCFGQSGPEMCLFSPSGCRVETPGDLQAAAVWRRAAPAGGRRPAGYDLLRPVLLRPKPTQARPAASYFLLFLLLLLLQFSSFFVLHHLNFVLLRFFFAVLCHQLPKHQNTEP